MAMRSAMASLLLLLPPLLSVVSMLISAPVAAQAGDDEATALLAFKAA